MNQEIKEKWVAALRSGDYKQGRFSLHNVEQGTFCCLGVLCDLAVQADALTILKVDGEKMYYGDDRMRGNAANLPKPAQRWAELDGDIPTVPVSAVLKEGRDALGFTAYEEEDGVVGLAGLNDSGLTFDEIADLIEEHL